MSEATPPTPEAPRRRLRIGRIAVAAIAACWLVGWVATWPTTPSDAPRPAPTPATWDGNAVDAYCGLGAMFQRSADYPYQTTGPTPAPGERRWYAANRALLPLLQRANALPETWIVRTPDRGMGRYFREAEIYDAVKDFVVLGRMAMKHALEAGKPAEALDASATCFETVMRLPGAPGSTVVTMALARANMLLHGNSLNRHGAAAIAAPEPALAAYARRLDAVDARRFPLEHGVLGHAEYMFAHELARPANAWESSDTDYRKLGFYHLIGAPAELRRRWGAHWAERVRARDFAAITEPGLRHQLRLSFAPYFHPHAGSAEAAADAMRQGLAAALPQWLLAEAEFQAHRIKVAHVRYARAHGGKPPTRLEQLVPAYLPAVPADPYDPGRAFGYDGTRAWSVGIDKVDQAGSPGFLLYQGEDQYVRGDERPGDIVFPL